MKPKRIHVSLLAAAIGFGLMAETPVVQASLSVSDSGAPLLVNKTHKLPDDYESVVSLVTVKNCFGKKFQVERETYDHFLELREDLLKSGIQIELESAYRSAARQRQLIEELRATEGEAYVKSLAALPGYSEHQTGLALDVAVVANGKTVDDVYETQETPYQKMHRKLADHGFILRYPPGKSGVTGYDYESWHIRYVGKEIAQKIFLQGLTLEEYLASGEETSAMKSKYGSAEYWTRRNPGGDAIMDESEREAVGEAMRKKSAALADMADYPDTLTGDEIRTKITSSKSSFWYFEPEKVYENGLPLSRARYWQAVDNCGFNALPARQTVRFALTTTRASLRHLPENSGWYEDSYDTHYDLLQGVTVDPAEPLAVLAESRDQRFCFVEMRNFSGWMDKDAIVFTDREKWMEYAAPENFLVITEHKKKIQVDDNLSLMFQMGSRLPLRRPAPQSDGTWLVSVPIDVNGTFRETTARIPADDTVHKGWLPYSENNLMRQAFRFLGELYGWGGLEEGVDCSLFTADVYRSLGLDIPADAEEQMLSMPVSLDLEKTDEKTKFETITKNLRPGDLLFTDGHVMMYLGQDDKGEPYVIHAGSSRWFPGEGEEGGPLKYYTRRVTVDDLRWFKGSAKTCLDLIINAGSMRADKKAED